jgi:hypothetical protein
MKKVLFIIAVLATAIVVMSACNRSKVADTNQISFGDTVGLAQFQQWKMQNETLEPTAYQQAVASAPRKTVARRTSNSTRGTMSTPTTNQAKVKKGWSKSAKYGVIGGAAGGVLGAVIDKKHPVRGAIIGVIVGGGAGYGIGRGQDRKDGRL